MTLDDLILVNRDGVKVWLAEAPLGTVPEKSAFKSIGAAKHTWTFTRHRPTPDAPPICYITGFADTIFGDGLFSPDVGKTYWFARLIKNGHGDKLEDFYGGRFHQINEAHSESGPVGKHFAFIVNKRVSGEEMTDYLDPSPAELSKALVETYLSSFLESMLSLRQSWTSDGKQKQQRFVETASALMDALTETP